MRAAILILGLALYGCSDRDPHRSGTVAGPLRGDYAISSQASGGETLAALGQDGLRVSIAPSFGRYHYYLSLRPLPAGCIPRDRLPDNGSGDGRGCGPVRVDVRRIDQTDQSIAAVRFLLPPEEGEMLLSRLDARLERWRGNNFGMLDGTGVDIERVRDGRTTSMSSNAYAIDPGNPVPQLSTDLQRVLLAYGPTGFAPRESGWHVRDDPAREDPCNRPGFATPLDRGFGAGNSDCDAAKRWP
jgi:hypothetical protein